MATTYRTIQGDMIDLVVQRHYGRTDRGLVELVLEANRAAGLSEHTPVLPLGTLITLPDPPSEALRPAATIKLWD